MTKEFLYIAGVDLINQISQEIWNEEEDMPFTVPQLPKVFDNPQHSNSLFHTQM